MTSSDLSKFTNGYILRNHQIIKDDLWVKAGCVINPEEIFYSEKSTPNTVYDVKGNLLVPGFIDIQINGGFGMDFSQNILNDLEENLGRVAFKLLQYGVTAFCPTLISSQPEIYREIMPKLKRHKGGTLGAEVLGIHLEGPFLNVEKRGAHFENNIKEPHEGVKSILEVYGNLEDVSIVTMAPELNKSMEVIDYLVSNNIKVSMGHSSASYEKGLEAIKHGSTLITHLFNAMTPFHHRNPGLVGLIGVEDHHKLYYTLIADGVHVHPAVIKMAFRANPRGIVLVTDATSAMGQTKGFSTMGDQIVEVKGNGAYIANTDILAGSIATMNQCVKCFKESTGCSLTEALEAASLHPAQSLDIDDHKGTLQFGADADFICIDWDLNILSTWIAGKCVYKKG